MDVVVYPAHLEGSLSAIASKSVAHRALMCAAFADTTTDIYCNTTSKDIEATADCLAKLGARVAKTKLGFRVTPLAKQQVLPEKSTLNCGESGSTLRFLLPCVAALGRKAHFVGEGRLPKRPLAPLDQELVAHGAKLDHAADSYLPLDLSGKFFAEEITLPGDISSQYISGLLMAAAAQKSKLDVKVQRPVESLSYIRITIDVLRSFGVEVDVDDGDPSFMRFSCDGTCGLKSPGTLRVEGDWSNAAFWLCAGALAGPCTVQGLNNASYQGDRYITATLSALGAKVEFVKEQVTVTKHKLLGRVIDAQDIPDLVPPLACVCTQAEGTTTIVGAKRLRIKESDRLETIAAALGALGAQIDVTDDGLIIQPSKLMGATVDAANDHRIAMMGAIAATVATGPTTICGAECVQKSYPHFFEDLQALGARVDYL